MKKEQEVKNYILKIENMTIEMKYQENGKEFNECILNLVKQREI